MKFQDIFTVYSSLSCLLLQDNVQGEKDEL